VVDCRRWWSAGAFVTSRELYEQGHDIPALDLLVVALGMEPKASRMAQAGEDLVLFEKVLSRCQELDRALASLTPLLGQLQDDSVVRSAIAIVCLQQGDARNALVQLEAAGAGAAARWPGFWRLKVDAAETAGRPEEAVETAVSVLAMAPATSPEHLEHAVSALKRLDPAAGAEALQRRRAAGTVQHPQYYKIMGELLAATGDFVAADRATNHAARLGPPNTGGDVQQP